eukprot:g79709.t1
MPSYSLLITSPWDLKAGQDSTPHVRQHSSSTCLHQFNEPRKTKSLTSRRRLKGYSRDMNKGQSLPTGSELERLLVVESEQKRSHLRNFLQVTASTNIT